MRCFIIQLYRILCDPMNCGSLQPDSLLCSWGIPRQEYWSGLPCPPPGDLPNLGIEPRSPAWQADSLPSEPPMWAKPWDPQGLQLAAPAVRCSPNGSRRRGVSALHTSSWADVKVIGAEGISSPSCRRFLWHFCPQHR